MHNQCASLADSSSRDPRPVRGKSVIGGMNPDVVRRKECERLAFRYNPRQPVERAARTEIGAVYIYRHSALYCHPRPVWRWCRYQLLISTHPTLDNPTACSKAADRNFAGNVLWELWASASPGILWFRCLSRALDKRAEA